MELDAQSVVPPAEVECLLRQLTETPDRLEALAHGLDDAQLQRRPSADAWSPNEILAHMRACAEVWGGSIVAMIEGDHPTLRYVSPRTWIRTTDYDRQPFRASLEAFTRHRHDVLQELRALGVAGWSRGAAFTGTTRGRQHTVLSYAHRIVQHEQEHLAQLSSTVRPR